MAKPVDGFLKLAVSTLLLGLTAGSGGCGKADHEGGASGSSGGTAGGSGVGGSVGVGGNVGVGGGVGVDGGAGVDGSVGSGGRVGIGDSAGSGGRVGIGGNVGVDGSVGSGGQVDTGGQGDGGGQVDTGGLDAAQGPDLLPIADVPVTADAPLPFWPGPFVADCAPPAVNGRQVADGHHHAGEDCMTSGCHRNPTGSPDGSGAPAFLFGGTVYRPSATSAGEPGVEVGVRAAQGFYSTCSAANGNFWYLAPSDGTSLTWPSATAQLRNATGEISMATPVEASCNAAPCHGGTYRIISPL
jgi:hypothetical protein